MRRTIAMLATAFALSWIPITGWAQASASGSDSLLQVLVDSASTPAEHQALARYFRAKAGDARALAELHQGMSRSYSGKPGEIQKMSRHCAQITKLNPDLLT